MTPRRVLQIGGLGLIALGLLIVFRTGTVAFALGAIAGNGPAVPGNPTWMAFWFQLTFMRLFSIAIIGLGVILWWCGTVLSQSQGASLVRILSVILGAFALTAVAQQVAIWNTNAGWWLSAAFIAAAATCVMSALLNPTRQAAEVSH